MAGGQRRAFARQGNKETTSDHRRSQHPLQPPSQAPVNGTRRPEDDDPPPATVLTITPDMAAGFMARNNRNRPRREDDINTYARDMIARDMARQRRDNQNRPQR